VSRRRQGPALGLADDTHGERLELFEQFFEAAAVVEQGLVALGLLGAHGAGDGLAAHSTGPRRVGPVELFGAGVAGTALAPAAGRALYEAPREAEADLGDLGHDLAASGLGFSW
jgi:hypothetical protein